MRKKCSCCVRLDNLSTINLETFSYAFTTSSLVNKFKGILLPSLCD